MSSTPAPNQKLDAQAFSLMLGDSLNEVITLNQWIEDLANQAHLTRELYFKLNLILEEAVTNIIQHGFVTKQQGRIEISIMFDNHHVHIKVKDNGVPFNPLEDHHIILPETLQTADVGGLGIHLIKSYTQSAHYQRVNDTNVLSLVIDNAA